MTKQDWGEVAAALYAMFIAVAAVLMLAAAAEGAEFSDGPPSSANYGYDYAPSTFYDESDNKWKMYWCGRTNINGHNRDAVWYSWSWDLAIWQDSQIVFQGTGGDDWDGGHICDPTVMQNQQYGDRVYPYVLFYTGLPFWTDYEGRIGVATSTDGVNWTRRGPLDLGCDDGGDGEYGCLHFSPVYVTSSTPGASRYVAIVQHHLRDDIGTYVYESYDGETWTGPNGGPYTRLCFQVGGCTNGAAKDLSYRPDKGYYITYTAEQTGGVFEFIYKAKQTWFNTLDTSQTVNNLRSKTLYDGRTPYGSAFSSGFHRDADGYVTFWAQNPTWLRTAAGDSIPGQFDTGDLFQTYYAGFSW